MNFDNVQIVEHARKPSGFGFIAGMYAEGVALIGLAAGLCFKAAT